MENKEWLFGLNLTELQRITAQLGLPRFAGGQITSWLYKKGATRIDRMSDLSLAHRAMLEERFEVGRIAPSACDVSADGTSKYLFPTLHKAAVEAVVIPDRERTTLCLSSQAGCRMGCRFCATGAGGFSHDLTAGEILNQVVSTAQAADLTNIVYMGMGEPADNADAVLRSLEILTAPWGFAWSPTRITLSTAGVLPALERFLAETKVHIAISLHNPFASQRLEIMPLQGANPIAGIVELLRRYDFSHQRRLSFEYIVLEGINDSPAHVRELVRLLSGLPCRINLIRFHAIPGSPFRSPPEQRMVQIRDELSRRGIISTIRASRGEDIRAACGLLSATTAENLKDD